MQTQLDEDHVLGQFDRLVEEGVVVYNTDYRTVTLADEGFSVRPSQDHPSLANPFSNHSTRSQFEFRILGSLATKPVAPSDPEKHESAKQPGCAPGSDINVSGYEVATVGSTHLLAFNKFPSARPHLLLLTQDGFKRQYAALDIDDIKAALQVLASLKTRRHLLFFNCGIDSGCSRMHKHMQVFPTPDPEQFPLWPDSKTSEPPFKAFICRFKPQAGPPPAEVLAGFYRELLRRAEKSVGHVTLEGEAALPHNVIMTRDWLVVIPRQAASWDGAATSAPGMLGMVWLHNEETMNLWVNRGPVNVLRRLGFPAEDTDVREPIE
jgi:ATP adenylyltransferase